MPTRHISKIWAQILKFWTNFFLDCFLGCKMFKLLFVFQSGVGRKSRHFIFIIFYVTFFIYRFAKFIFLDEGIFTLDKNYPDPKEYFFG